MRITRGRRQGAAVTGLMLAATLLATPTGRSGTSAEPMLEPAPQTVTAVAHADISQAQVRAVAAKPNDVRAYWTPARMRAALPLGLDGLGNLLKPKAPAKAGTTTTAAGPTAPRTVGKLFFTTSAGDAVCSASSVNTPTKNLIITAGHCTNDGPVRCGVLGGSTCPTANFTNFLFVPRYRNGAGPDGSWVGRAVLNHSAWTRSGNLDYDHALITIAPRAGRNLVSVIGGNGLAMLYGSHQNRVRIWGWPAEAPYDGSTARQCFGNTTSFDSSGDAQLACPMTGGASGGPWFLSMSSASAGFIWAVTSRRTITGPKYLVAHPLSGAVMLLLSAAARPGVRGTSLLTTAYTGVARRTSSAPMTFMAFPDDVGRGQLLGTRAWARAGTRVVLQVRYPGTGWRHVGARFTNSAGQADFPHVVGAPGTRYYRTVTSTSRSNAVHVYVQPCPMPADQTTSVVRATRCSAPVG